MRSESSSEKQNISPKHGGNGSRMTKVEGEKNMLDLSKTWFWLYFSFNGISTLDAYLMPNPVGTLFNCSYQMEIFDHFYLIRTILSNIIHLFAHS